MDFWRFSRHVAKKKKLGKPKSLNLWPWSFLPPQNMKFRGYKGENIRTKLTGFNCWRTGLFRRRIKPVRWWIKPVRQQMKPVHLVPIFLYIFFFFSQCWLCCGSKMPHFRGSIKVWHCISICMCRIFKKANANTYFHPCTFLGTKVKKYFKIFCVTNIAHTNLNKPPVLHCAKIGCTS